MADVTGLELEPVVDDPGSAFGAAFAAGMGTGAFGEWSDIARFVALGERAPTDRSRGRVRRALRRLSRSLPGAPRGLTAHHRPPRGT